jgi:hypothetical protein
MKRILACMVVAVCFVSSSVHAYERPLDAGLGALSGGAIFGPVGAIAGGVIGYTRGPSIARSLGLRGHRHHRRYAR